MRATCPRGTSHDSGPGEERNVPGLDTIDSGASGKKSSMPRARRHLARVHASSESQGGKAADGDSGGEKQRLIQNSTGVTPGFLNHLPRLGARVAHEVVCRACVHVAGHLGHQLGRRGGLLRSHQLGERLDDPRRRSRRGPSWPSTRQGRPSAPRVAIYPPWARGRAAWSGKWPHGRLRAGALVAKGTFGRAGARRRRSRRPAAAPRGRAPGSTRRRPRRSAPSTRPPRGRESRGSGGPRGVRVRLRVRVRVPVRVRVRVRVSVRI